MWYTASLMFEGIHDIQPGLVGLWEEVIVLIQADTEAEVERAAQALGVSKEHEYYVSEPARHLLRWRFARIDRICPVEEALTSGAEVFSRFLRQEEAESLRNPFPDS